MLNDVFPLRVEAVPAARASEWRADDSFPPRQTQAWQLIYVCSGTIEERCDDRRVLLRAGGLLFQQHDLPVRRIQHSRNGALLIEGGIGKTNT